MKKQILILISLMISFSSLATDYKVISCQGDSVVINESVSPRGGYSVQLVIGHDEINEKILATSIAGLTPNNEYIIAGSRGNCFENVPRRDYHSWYDKKWCIKDYRNHKNVWIGHNSSNNALFLEFYHMNSHERSTQVYIEDCHLVNEQNWLGYK